MSWTLKWKEAEKFERLGTVNSDAWRKPKYPREQAAQNIWWSGRRRYKDHQITNIKSSDHPLQAETISKRIRESLVNMKSSNTRKIDFYGGVLQSPRQKGNKEAKGPFICWAWRPWWVQLAQLTAKGDELCLGWCIQYWPKGSQHLHARKMRAIWRIYAQNTRKLHARNTRVKFYTSYYSQLNYTWIACILAKDESFCY